MTEEKLEVWTAEQNPVSDDNTISEIPSPNVTFEVDAPYNNKVFKDKFDITKPGNWDILDEVMSGRRRNVLLVSPYFDWMNKVNEYSTMFVDLEYNDYKYSDQIKNGNDFENAYSQFLISYVDRVTKWLSSADDGKIGVITFPDMGIVMNINGLVIPDTFNLDDNDVLTLLFSKLKDCLISCKKYVGYKNISDVIEKEFIAPVLDKINDEESVIQVPLEYVISVVSEGGIGINYVKVLSSSGAGEDEIATIQEGDLKHVTDKIKYVVIPKGSYTVKSSSDKFNLYLFKYTIVDKHLQDKEMIGQNLKLNDSVIDLDDNQVLTIQTPHSYMMDVIDITITSVGK